MNPLLDIQILGWLLVALGLFEGVPLLAALAWGEPVLPYAASALAALAFGLPIVSSTRPTDRRMRPRDGFLVVVAGWILASLFGALPYALSGELSPVNSLFEAVAGFTTTGSTVLSPIEGRPHGILLWRSITQWVGGMGIIVFAVAILPLLGIGGMQLFKAEMPGPVVDKLTPHVADTARRLWLIYVLLTLAAGVSLLLAGMPAFDALCHALTVLSTGGFSTRDASIGAFESPLIEWIVVVFMFLAAVNFVLHYRAATGRLRQVVADFELRTFLAVLLSATAIISIVLLNQGFEGGKAVRQAAFQVVSIATTTGYGTADYEPWSPLAHLLLLALMVMGGMAGSTAGGVKVLRVILWIQTLRTMVARAIHPHSVQPIRHGGREVADEVLAGIGAFLVGYLLLASTAAFTVAMAGYDVPTAISSALTAVGNVGPGLGAVGPTESFAHFPGGVKLVLCFCMLAGRLEILTLLVVIRPEFWRR